MIERERGRKDWRIMNEGMNERMKHCCYLQPILEFPFRVIESVKMKGSLSICHFIHTWGQTKIWNLQQSSSNNNFNYNQIKYLFIHEIKRRRKKECYTTILCYTFYPPFYSNFYSFNLKSMTKSKEIIYIHPLLYSFAITFHVSECQLTIKRNELGFNSLIFSATFWANWSGVESWKNLFAW